MGKFVKGYIVVVPFPFSNLRASKRRPAVILAVLPGDDLILSQITSKNHSDNFSVALMLEDIDGGSLLQNSFIRPNKLFTADKNLILYKVGALTPEKLKSTIEKVIEIITV